MVLPRVLDGEQPLPCHDPQFLKPFGFRLPQIEKHCPVPADFWPPVRGIGKLLADLSPGTRSVGRKIALPSLTVMPILRWHSGDISLLSELSF